MKEACGLLHSPGPLIRLERIVSLGLAGLGLIHAALFALAMLPSSLWIDEIISIRDFSGQGVWASLSRYSEPNNHIFFNVLQALSPFQGSYQPLAARTLSVLYSVGGLALGWLFLWRRRRFLEAGVFVLLLGSCLELWAVLFHARGYGLQFLLVTAVAWLVWDFDADPGSRRKWLLGTGLVMTVWTAPSALLVLAPAACLTCFRSGRKIELIRIAAWSGAAALMVHLPLLGAFWRVYTNYAHGRRFEDWHAVRNVVQIFFGPTQFVVSAVLVCISLVFAGWLMHKERYGADKAAIWLVALVAGIVLARLVATPPPRVFAPFAGVLWLGVIWCCGDAVRSLPHPRYRTIVSGCLIGSAFCVWPHLRHVGDFHYAPIEDWKGAAEFVTRSFPPGTLVWAPHRPELLRIYLPEDYPFTTAYEPDAFVRGRQVAVDSCLTDEPRLGLGDFEVPFVRWVRIPQIRRGYQGVFFAKPPAASSPKQWIDDPVRGWLWSSGADEPDHAFIFAAHRNDWDAVQYVLLIEVDGSIVPVGREACFYEGAVVIPLRRSVVGVLLPAEDPTDSAFHLDGWFTSSSVPSDSGGAPGLLSLQ